MFKVDRKSAEVKSFDKPGTYEVSIVKIEPGLTAKGDAKVKLTLRGDDGSVVSDNILNRDTTWWRINQLLAACPAVEVKEGEELDFSKVSLFNEFMNRFLHQGLSVKLKEETYVQDGETKKVMRVDRFVKSDNPF